MKKMKVYLLPAILIAIILLRQYFIRHLGFNPELFGGQDKLKHLDSKTIIWVSVKTKMNQKYSIQANDAFRSSLIFRLTPSKADFKSVVKIFLAKKLAIIDGQLSRTENEIVFDPIGDLQFDAYKYVFNPNSRLLKLDHIASYNWPE